MRWRSLCLLLFLSGIALVQLPEPQHVHGLETWRWQGDHIALRGGLKTLQRRGFIYLLSLRYAELGPARRSPYYKIGGTTDMGQRLPAYVTAQPFRPELLRLVAVPDWRAAEARLLRRFARGKDMDGGSEWRRLEQEEVELLMSLMEEEADEWKQLSEEILPVQQLSDFMELKPMESTWSLEALQGQAARAVLDELNRLGRTTVIMPQNTALRQVAVEVLSMLNRSLSVVMVPRASDAVATLSQMNDDLVKACIVTERRLGWKEAYTSGSYLEEHGLHLMYTVAQVAEFLEGPRKKVILCARGGYPLLRSALRQRNQQVDLLICEFLLRTTMNQRAGSRWEDIFDDDYIPVQNRLFLSSSTAVYQLHNKRFMSICAFPEKYGSVAFRLPRTEAVRNGLLRPVRLVCWPQQAGKKAVDRAKAISAFVKQRGVKKMYAFLAKNDAAEELHECLLAEGLRSVCVNGHMRISDRYAYAESFGAEPTVVSSAFVVLENQSAPAADAAFICPWKQSSMHLDRVISLLSQEGSERDIGEILFLHDKRRAMEQPLALALLCLIDEDSNSLEALKQLVLRSIERGQDLPWDEWPVEIQLLVDEGSVIPVRVLAECYSVAIGVMQDPKAQEWSFRRDVMAALRRRLGHLELPPGYRVAGLSVGQWMQEQREAAQQGLLDGRQFQELLDLGVSFGGEGQWDQRYRQLLPFCAHHPLSDLEDLSTWLKRQRAQMRQGTLSLERQRSLESLGVEPGLSREDSWDQHLEALRAFAVREKHCDVASSHVEGELKLGAWVNHQRQRWAAGKLDPVRERILVKVGLELKPRSSCWDDYIEILQSFQAREGHLDVSLEHVEQGLALGRWLEDQRSRDLHGGLSPRQRSQLRRMGVEMDAEEARWAWHYRALQDFTTEEGHSNVPLSGTKGCQSLGRWLYSQKRKYAQDQLGNGRLRMLQGLGVELAQKRSGSSPG